MIKVNPHWRYKSSIHEFVFQIEIRLRLLRQAILGRPIIYGCIFKSGIEIEGNGVYVANNQLIRK